MCGWFKKLLADKDGNPSEHIVAALWGSFVIIVLTIVLCYMGHPPALTDFAMAHGGIWGVGAAGQRFTGGT